MEQKRELRAEYREQGWLNTDEIRAAVKAYRLFKGKVNIDDVYDNYKMLSGGDAEEEAWLFSISDSMNMWRYRLALTHLTLGWTCMLTYEIQS